MSTQKPQEVAPKCGLEVTQVLLFLLNKPVLSLQHQWKGPHSVHLLHRTGTTEFFLLFVPRSGQGPSR